MSEIGQRVIEGVRLAAAERPKYVYEKDAENRCGYIRDGAPSCLVGQGLWSAGLIDSNWRGDDAEDSRISAIVFEYEWPLDPDEVDWLTAVQDAQDVGEAWGYALKFAND